MSGQYYDNDDTKIRGNSDESLIGNVGDRLKVDVGAGNVNVVSQDSAQFYASNNQLYSAAADINCATAGTNNPLLLFRNPTGSGKKITIWGIECGSSVANVAIQFKVYQTPTVTSNGTTLTPRPRNLGNSQPSAVALVTTLPTVSSNGSEFENVVIGQNTASSSIMSHEFSFYMQPNTAILLTGSPASNNRNAAVTIIWAEVSI